MNKILVFSTHTSLDNRITKYLKTVSSAGYSVLYTNSHSDENKVKINGVEHNNIKQSFDKHNAFGALLALHKMDRVIKVNSTALCIHVHDPLLLPLSKIAKRQKIFVVYDRHESYNLANGLNGRLSSFMERRYKKYIDAVVYVNDVQGVYLDNENYTRIVKIPNYQSQNAYSSAIKEKMPHNGIKIVYFGVINDTSRDCSLMLSAIDELLAVDKDIVFELGGPIEGDVLESKIVEMQAKYDNFNYLGVLKYDEVIKRTVSADVGIYLQKFVPNNVGSSPNKIYEYLMAGLAICAQGRFEDWDKINDYAGCVLPYESSADDVISALKDICYGNKLQLYKDNALNLSKNFTWESIEERYLELYRELERIK